MGINSSITQTQGTHQNTSIPLIKNAQFRNMWLGYFLSGLGDQLYIVAIPLLVYDLTHSALLSGTMTAFEYLPTALFGLFIGVFLDRYSRKMLLVLGLLIQAVLVFVVPYGIQQGYLAFGALYALAFLMSTAGLVVRTAYEVVMPSVVQKDQLVKASATINYTFTLIRMIGPALAGVLVDIISYVKMMALDAASFLIYGILILFMKIDQPPARKQSMLQSFKEGMRFLGKDSILRPLILGYFAANLGYGLVTPLLIFTMKDRFDAGTTMIGLVFTLAAVGSFVGNTLYLRLSKKMYVGRQMIWTASVISVGFFLMGIAPNLPIFIVGYFFNILGTVWANGNFYYVLQSRSPEATRGRTSSTTLTLTRITAPLMAALGGVLAKYMGLSIIYYIATGTILLSMFISWKEKLWEVREVVTAEIE